MEVSDINRPALQLTGFFERFDSERVQVIGYVEYSYLTTLEEKKEEIYDTLLSYKIPCLIFCRALKPDDMLLQKATEANIPVFSTDSHTSAFMAEIIRWLNVQLAPCISIHGVLVDVYGVGVLIMGESGIGKSEALELIKRGHRLVSDDVVEIRKVSDETLVEQHRILQGILLSSEVLELWTLRLYSVFKASERPRILTLLLHWRSGIKSVSMIAWDWKISIQNFLGIR